METLGLFSYSLLIMKPQTKPLTLNATVVQMRTSCTFKRTGKEVPGPRAVRLVRAMKTLDNRKNK